MLRTILILVAATLLAACGDSDPKPGTPAASTSAVTSTATAPDDGAPMPQHLTFAPGDTIAADGKAGIFFLDPKTGDAEAWVVGATTVPGQDGGLPFSFTVGGISSDGAKLVYTCLKAPGASPTPCSGGTDIVWYLLDTITGQRTRITTFSGEFLTISPDGKTLLGATATGVALADTSRSETQRLITLPSTTDSRYPRLNWSSAGARVLLTMGLEQQTFLVDTETASIISAPDLSTLGASWSPDGSQLVSWKQIGDNDGELRVLDRDGRLIWSKPSSSGAVSWSADGSLMLAEVQDQPGIPNVSGPLDRVDIIDANTGAALYRIKGGFCPIGWVGQTHRLLADSYGFGEVLADLDTRSIKLLDTYVTPLPFDNNIAIQFNFEDFTSYDLATGTKKLIAHTTVSPSWDPNHPVRFAGNRIAFTPLHGGHGGCGEGNGPQNPPSPQLLIGPFADDAPVTRGPGH